MHFIAFLSHNEELPFCKSLIEGHAYFYPNMIGDNVLDEFARVDSIQIETIEISKIETLTFVRYEGVNQVFLVEVPAQDYA